LIGAREEEVVVNCLLPEVEGRDEWTQAVVVVRLQKSGFLEAMVEGESPPVLQHEQCLSAGGLLQEEAVEPALFAVLEEAPLSSYL
jgi:hypothetical protein